MKVLSLFDGISCGQMALIRANIKISRYFASEIKQFAINKVKNQYPNTTHIGDVTKIHYRYGKILATDETPKELISEDGYVYKSNDDHTILEDYYLDTVDGQVRSGKIDMIIGGSPCQDFSTAKAFNKPDAYGLAGDKSGLFYFYLGILKEIKSFHDVYFFLENVRMKKESEKELNQFMGVDGIHINSTLVSYQNRPRIYWTNIPNIELPEDRNINFQNYIMKTLPKFEDTIRNQKYGIEKEDIKLTNDEINEICDLNKGSRNRLKEFGYTYSNEEFVEFIHNQLRESVVNKTKSRDKMWDNGEHKNSFSCYNITNSNKVHCLTRKQDRCPNSGLIAFGSYCRFLTRFEMELAQTVDANWTKDMTYANLQDVLGDGWTVDVIAHILSHLPKEFLSNKFNN